MRMVSPATSGIIAKEAFPQLACLDAHYRIRLRIEGRLPSEHFQAESEFLNLVAVSAESLSTVNSRSRRTLSAATKPLLATMRRT